MRYKRYRKKRSNVVKMRFQSFVDLSTEADTMKIISVSAGGPNVLQRLQPFFNAYKYYKLGSVSIKLVPASTLPVDPLGLSYDADDLDAIDPRDQLTPGMCRITNGEDILEDLTGLTGDQQRELYNNMLLDPRWFKWMLQTGVKRFGKPRYWQIGQLHQDKYPGSTRNIPLINPGSQGGSPELYGSASVTEAIPYGLPGYWSAVNVGSSPRGIFQTGHRGILGWMPTDGLQKTVLASNGILVDSPLIASPVEVELFKILMPPVRKTNYYYRMFITETVFFKEPIVLGLNGYRPIDVFHVGNAGEKYSPAMPTTPRGYSVPPAYQTGDNYGDDQNL